MQRGIDICVEVAVLWDMIQAEFLMDKCTAMNLVLQVPGMFMVLFILRETGHQWLAGSLTREKAELKKEGREKEKGEKNKRGRLLPSPPATSVNSTVWNPNLYPVPTVRKMLLEMFADLAILRRSHGAWAPWDECRPCSVPSRLWDQTGTAWHWRSNWKPWHRPRETDARHLPSASQFCSTASPTALKVFLE